MYEQTSREKQLVELLNKYDTGGVKFDQAKKELLTKGFTESEIIHGLYLAPFDGRYNKPAEKHPLHDYYLKNPQKAEEMAKNLLLEDALKENDKLLANTAASGFGPDIQSRLYYQVRTSDLVGWPIFTIYGLIAVLFIIMIKLNLPVSIVNGSLKFIEVVAEVYLFYLLSKKYLALRKLKNEVKQYSKNRYTES